MDSLYLEDPNRYLIDNRQRRREENPLRKLKHTISQLRNLRIIYH